MTTPLAAAPPRRSGAPLILLLVLAALLAAACSTGAAAGPSVASLADPAASPDAPGASPSASLSPEDAMLAFTTCMREQGIDIADPQTAGGEGGPRIAIRKAAGAGAGKGFDDFQKANDACRHHLANMPQGPMKEMDQETKDALLAFARCMRENGVDMPDPQFENGGGIVRIGGPDEKGIDRGSGDFEAAHEACRHHLPGGGEGGPSISVGGPGSGSAADPVGPGTDEKP